MSANEERLYTVQELVDAGIVGDPVDGGRSRLLEILGDDVVFDAIFRPCLAESVAVRLAEERREEQARQEEEAARRAAEWAEARQPPRGVPAVEGATTGLEALQAQPGYVTPSVEYGRPRPRFIEEQLAEGKAAAAAKQKAADKLKKDRALGKGKDQ